MTINNSGVETIIDFEGCVKLAQKYLSKPPLIVLGSGASMEYGLPSMSDLAEEICKDAYVMKDKKFPEFSKKVKEVGLEAAIDAVKLQDDTLQIIRKIIWQIINEKDFQFFLYNKCLPQPELITLLQKVLEPTPNKAVIVTTNYDRIPEYAADYLDTTVVNGFEGNLIRKMASPSHSISKKRIAARERIVEIWKVHGSLDWFQNNSETQYSFPFSREVPIDFQPLIVPPGKKKYEQTYAEPYRTMINNADRAFTIAESYLCVGYGFNDEHIQPKLISQIEKGKPIVVLARTMSKACKKHIIEDTIKNYLIFEQADDAHTRVYHDGASNVYDGSYWKLEEFMKIW